MEGLKIQWKRVPRSVVKLSNGRLHVESQTTDQQDGSADEYDTVLLAIGMLSDCGHIGIHKVLRKVQDATAAEKSTTRVEDKWITQRTCF